MGKGQSKHGQCYLVNAHFNPLCQLEETNSIQSIETPLTSQDSGLQLTPEISFIQSEEDKSNSNQNVPTKCALQVFLPNESVTNVLKNATMDVKFESANSNNLENQQKVVLECVQNNNQSEKQEISFVLRNYINEETNKDDVEKILWNSICEALKSSLKLPPSGTHTLKVHLTLSPDQERSLAKSLKSASPPKEVETTEPAFNLCQSKPADPLPSVVTSTPQKHASVFAKCCQPEVIKNLLHSPAKSFRNEASPSPRSRRHRMCAERRESKKWIDAANMGHKDFIVPKFKSPRHFIARERQQDQSSEAHPNVEDCSHYLDLARLKISEAKEHSLHRTDPRCMNLAYCSPRHIERSHRLCHYQKCAIRDEFSSNRTPKRNTDIRHKLQESEIHTDILKYKLLQKAKNNLLDLSFDLCDLDDKTSAEVDGIPFEHRRSQSYDTNQYSFVNSPKTKSRVCHCVKCIPSVNYDEFVPPSPGRHHRHCHRKREKDKIRAMEQVAQWLEREDSNIEKTLKQDTSLTTTEKDGSIQRHEYHHIHEHHHYYHYMDS